MYLVTRSETEYCWFQYQKTGRTYKACRACNLFLPLSLSTSFSGWYFMSEVYDHQSYSESVLFLSTSSFHRVSRSVLNLAIRFVINKTNTLYKICSKHHMPPRIHYNRIATRKTANYCCCNYNLTCVGIKVVFFGS